MRGLARRSFSRYSSVVMYSIEWEFFPHPSRIPEFFAAYGAEGRWVRLFRKAEGYVGTDLAPVPDKPGWFRTIDRWASKDAYADFRERYSGEYRALDEECEKLTLQEKLVA